MQGLNKISQFYKRLGLRAQLLILIISLSLIFTFSFSYIHQVSEEKIFDLVENQIDELSKAIEISVEQITATGTTDETRLKEYINRLKKKGIKEISILSNKQQVIASSNPKKVGAKMSVAKNELVIQATMGENEGMPKKIYNVIVPVTVKNTLIGYIHLSMFLEDFEKLSEEMFYKRLMITLLILGIGVSIAVFLSHKYTQPISSLIRAARGIADGKIPTIPENFQGELGELARSFNEMILRLKEQNELQKRVQRLEQQAMLGHLASGIAHEVRNPLNLINLTIDHFSTLNLHSEDVSAEDVKLHINRMKEEMRHVTNIVSNFLDLGKELKLSPVRIRCDLLVEEVIDLTQHKISNQKVVVHRYFNSPIPEINVDIDKMRSCLMNVILNSIDAMQNGGELDITINSENGFAEIKFKDTGIGIKSKDLSHIFEPFYTTKKTGIGIGLAIAKRVVEAHGGRIIVNSEVEQGTTVDILIPVCKEDERT